MKLEILSRVSSKTLGVMKCVNNHSRSYIGSKYMSMQYLNMFVSYNRQHFIFEVAGGVLSISYQLDKDFSHLGGYRRVFFRGKPVVDYIISVNGLVLKLGKEDKLSLINPILGESMNILGCFIHFPS